MGQIVPPSPAGNSLNRTDIRRSFPKRENAKSEAMLIHGKSGEASTMLCVNLFLYVFGRLVKILHTDRGRNDGG
ncbi:MAG: hypothetical protein WBF93_15940 [Pirellulales bacterium]